MQTQDQPWTEFACRVQNRNSRYLDRNNALDDVYHVAHIGDACRILQDGEITARRIGDESVLRTTTTDVAWVSANRWANGSIYGNVQFEFDWGELVDGKKIYWVEKMPYRPPAYRFLITDRNHDHSRHVRRYNPEVDEGPLRLRNGRWFCNVTNVTSEFMLERGLSIARCKTIKFVNHHPQLCKLHGSGCSDRLRQSDSVGGQILAFAIANRKGRLRHCFLEEGQGGLNGLALRPDIRNSLEFLLSELSGGELSGPIRSSARSQSALRGALALYGNGFDDDARDLVDVLASSKTLKKALENLASHFLKLAGITLRE